MKRSGISFQAALDPIVEQVSAKHQLEVREILGYHAAPVYVRARHELFWRAYYEAGLTAYRLASLLNRDHAGIMYGIKRHQERMGVSIG